MNTLNENKSQFAVNLSCAAHSNVVKGSGPAVYLILDDGKKHHIPNPKVYNMLFTSWSIIRHLSNAQLNKYPTGKALNWDARLVAAHGQAAIYFQNYGIKRHIGNPATFNALGFSWTKVGRHSAHNINALRTGPPIICGRPKPSPRFYKFINCAPHSNVIKGSGPAVYLILDDGKKHHIPNPTVYNKLFTSWSIIRHLSNAQLNKYPTGKPLNWDARLVAARGQAAVYFQNYGIKRHVTSPKVMNALGFNWSKVERHHSAHNINALRTGPPIYCGKALPAPKPSPTPATYNIDGEFKNAVNGHVIKGLKNLHITVIGADGKIHAGKFKNDKYYFTGLAPQRYTFKISAKGWIGLTTKKTLTKKNFGIAGLWDFTLSSAMQNDQWRIILTWSSVPEDLDATLMMAGNDRCNYDHTISRDGNAKLDTDSRKGFGPETITLTNKLHGNGFHSYYVHNYSQKPSITISKAKVAVYNGKHLVKIYSVPTSGKGTYWHVFDLTAKGLKSQNKVVKRIKRNQH